MKQFAIDLLSVILAFIFAVMITAIMYASFGAIFYFGLPALGVEVSFYQAFMLALLISVVGILFRGGNARKQTKGDD